MKSTLYIALTLDGYIADSAGGVDWLTSFDDALAGFPEFLDSVDHLVMGRSTYEQIAAWGEWPYGSKPVTVIASTTVARHSEHVEVRHPDAVKEWAATLEGKHLWIVGGAKTASLFARHGLLCELRLFFIPRFLGSGIPLFGPEFCAAAPTLTHLGRFPSGVVEARYSVAKQSASGEPS